MRRHPLHPSHLLVGLGAVVVLTLGASPAGATGNDGEHGNGNARAAEASAPAAENGNADHADKPAKDDDSAKPEKDDDRADRHERTRDRDGDADRDRSSSFTEDDDTNDGGTRNNVADDGDNAHPSGRDRSVENGGSGNQGRAESDPDDDGRGPDRSNGGPDKPNGSGGVDAADQDGNNGCGNDDDFEDDNEGWCGRKPHEKPAKPAVKPHTQPEAKPEAKPVTPEAAAETDECADGAMAEDCGHVTAAVPAISFDCHDFDICETAVAPAVSHRATPRPVTQVLGASAEAPRMVHAVSSSKPLVAQLGSGVAAVAGGAAALAFTGLELLPLVALGLGLTFAGAALQWRARRTV